MAGTTNFGPATLAPGTYEFGPTALADNDTEAQLTVDRTITGGLNSLTSATTVFINVEQSNDSGVTWFQRAANTFDGGVYTIKPSLGGGTLNTNGFTVNLAPGTGRQARATVQVSGTSVAVQGSLVIS